MASAGMAGGDGGGFLNAGGLDQVEAADRFASFGVRSGSDARLAVADADERGRVRSLQRRAVEILPLAGEFVSELDRFAERLLMHGGADVFPVLLVVVAKQHKFHRVDSN